MIGPLLMMTLGVLGQSLLDRLERVDPETATPIVDAIIQTDVDGQPDQARDGLIQWLITHPPARSEGRHLVAEAIAYTQQPNSHDPPPKRVELQALGRTGGYDFVAFEDHWLGTGDWLGALYLAEVGDDHLLFMDRAGGRTLVQFNRVDRPSEGMILRDCPAVGALAFAARHAGLNLLTPSDLSCRVSLTMEFTSWLDVAARVADACDLFWSKHQRSLVVQRRSGLDQGQPVTAANGKQEIGVFLQRIAASQGMDLLMDDRIGRLEIEVTAQQLHWQEALDCVALMNALEWTVVEDTQPNQLIVTRK